ncbi:MAG: hypothetical protein AAF411_13335 [Myxococcota bacterium]
MLVGFAAMIFFLGVERPAIDVLRSSSWPTGAAVGAYEGLRCYGTDGFLYPGDWYSPHYQIDGRSDLNYDIAFREANVFWSERAIWDELCTIQSAHYDPETKRAVLLRTLPLRAYDPAGLFVLLLAALAWRLRRGHRRPRIPWLATGVALAAVYAVYTALAREPVAGLIWPAFAVVAAYGLRRRLWQGRALARAFVLMLLCSGVPTAIYLWRPEWTNGTIFGRGAPMVFFVDLWRLLVLVVFVVVAIALRASVETRETAPEPLAASSPFGSR